MSIAKEYIDLNHQRCFEPAEFCAEVDNIIDSLITLGLVDDEVGISLQCFSEMIWFLRWLKEMVS